MATNSKKEAKEIQRLQQGAEANQTKSSFTPEQCRLLGEAYRLILSWRVEPEMQPKPVISDGDQVSATPSRDVAVEVEA
jgi:hypothetical protein